MLSWFDLNLPSSPFPLPLLSPPVSLLLSVFLPHEYWAAHQIFIAHNTQSAMHWGAHTHTHTQASIWTFNKRTSRTLTLAHSVLCTSTHTFTHIRTVVPVIYMLQEKEPAQTKRPWKFNTYSVQWIHKQTHTEPWVCASIDSPHLFLYSHLLKFNLQDVKWVLLLSCLYHLYF